MITTMRSLPRFKIKTPALAAVLFCALVASGSHALGAKLKPDTLKAWEEYQRLTEARIASELESSQGFLVQDFLPSEDQARYQRALEQGSSAQVFVPWTGSFHVDSPRERLGRRW